MAAFFCSFYTTYKCLVWINKKRRLRVKESIHVGFELLQGLLIQDG